MIRINNKEVDIGHFPDGTLLLKENMTDAAGNSAEEIEIRWNYYFGG